MEVGHLLKTDLPPRPLSAHGKCVIRVSRVVGRFLGRKVNIVLEIVRIRMLEPDTKIGREQTMNDEQEYRDEIRKLEAAVKALLYIVSEYVPLSDHHNVYGHKIDFSPELTAVRAALKQTETFKASWEDKT